ncbi:phage replisome organizer N-terminal domain-containing protein [Enterococcus rotai]|uniref:phage replisome organizer N-terminal domain-containing protein n=1 Tax=Enterococcus rotai TaxID=118060 RepID=UPI0035C710F7
MANKFKNDPKKKRYYWLQLKEDFFNQKEIKLLRRIAGGDTYTIIYLKMLLLSLRDEGKLFFEAIGDNFAEEVALSLDETPEDVAITISYLESKGLLEVIEQDEYFLNRVPELLGSESYSAERVRRHRERNKEQEKLQGNGDALQSNTDVTKRRDREDIEIDKSNNKPSIKELTERFNSLWKEYPNKKGKEKAFKSYQKAIKDGVTDETIQQGINNYIQEIQFKRTDKQYIAHGSTWFGNRRWGDEYETGRHDNSQRQSTSNSGVRF